MTEKTDMAALRKALIASLVVYALPVVGRHNYWFWGNRLWAEVTAGEKGREALWIAADLGLALGLQLVAALLYLLDFPRSGRAPLVRRRRGGPGLRLELELGLYGGPAGLFSDRPRDRP